MWVMTRLTGTVRGAHAPLTVSEAAVIRGYTTYDWRRRTEDFRREQRVVERPFPAHFRASQRPLPAMRPGVATPGHRRTLGRRVGGEGEGRPGNRPRRPGDRPGARRRDRSARSGARARRARIIYRTAGKDDDIAPWLSDQTGRALPGRRRRGHDRRLDARGDGSGRPTRRRGGGRGIVDRPQPQEGRERGGPWPPASRPCRDRSLDLRPR